MNIPYTGSCLCGRVRYEVKEIEPRMAHCHCTMCRKFHGASFSTFGEARKENFKWISGEDQLSEYVASNGSIRKFCRNCGSSLIFSPYKEGFDYVEFALGTLDSDIPMKPDAHVYVRYKANWTCINDNLPKYVEGRDSERIE